MLSSNTCSIERPVRPALSPSWTPRPALRILRLFPWSASKLRSASWPAIWPLHAVLAADQEHSRPEHPHPADTDHPVGPEPAHRAQPEPSGVSAETPPAARPVEPTSSSLADALLVLAESFLSHGASTADDPDVYQVVIHLGPGAVTPPGHIPDIAGVSAETPAVPTNPPAPGHPADPARCHVEDGPALSAATAQRIACSATWTWMLHDSAGKLLDLGHRRRRPSSALRRAARDRDHGRCRFPGCESRRIDLHHIQYWSNGGHTKLDNLISLCRHHHQVVHDRGYLIALTGHGTFTFYRPDGTAVPAAPTLPPSDGSIEDDHDADITPETIIPAWYGERLDLDHAIYVCFANAALAARTQAAAEAKAAEEDEVCPEAATSTEAATYPVPPVQAAPPGPASRRIIANSADVRLLSQPFAWTPGPPRWTSG